MGRDNSQKILIFLLLIAVVSLVFLILKFVIGLNLSSVEEYVSSGQDLREVGEDESSISDYFEGDFSDGDLGEDRESTLSSQGLCEIDGEVVKEGTVRFGTTCVVKPQQGEE